ncbi:hypothetical protein BH23ACT9_BH23ACT9_04640 [soil metagenome]
MTGDRATWDRADQVRAHNDDLDRQLRALVDRVPADQLRHDPGDGEWTLAENLAHLGEFPHYFARELTHMLAADDDVEVGRTHEHPERNEAIAAASHKAAHVDQLDRTLPPPAG